MNTLFMSLVSLSGKTWQKTDLLLQSDHLQPPFAHNTLAYPLHGSHHHRVSHLLVCDDAANGISGPYDDDGEPE